MSWGNEAPVPWHEAERGSHRRVVTAHGVRLVPLVEPAPHGLWHWSVRAYAGPDMGVLWLAPEPPARARHRTADAAKAAADAWLSAFAAGLREVGE